MSGGDKNKSRVSGVLLTASAALAYAFNGVVAKWLLDAGMPSFRLTQARTFFAGIIFLLWAILTPSISIKIKRINFPALIIFALIGFVGVQGFYFYSIHAMPISVALIIEFTAPIWITLYLRFVKHESVAKSMWYGIGLGLIGLVLLAQIWKGLTFSGLGMISSFFDALSLAFYYYRLNELIKRINKFTLLAWSMLLSSLLISFVMVPWKFPVKYLTEQIPLTSKLAPSHLPGWVLMSWVVIMGTVLPYICVVKGLVHLNPATTSTIGMLEPVLAGVFAWIMLGEKFNGIQLLGALVVLIGIYFAEKASRETPIMPQ